MEYSLLAWVVFNVFVLLMLALDLGVFHREAHKVSTREALAWTFLWIALSLIFNVGVWWYLGGQKALEYFTGYLLEKSLSVDNIFVFMLIFQYFQVPQKYRHRVLFWGIIGALVMRAFFIAVGVTLISLFHWVVYLFGAFLVYTAWKMATELDREIHPERNPVLVALRRFMPVTSDYEGGHFLVRKRSKLYATPLLVVLVVVESTDVVFAVDSIPAVLAITQDPFIVYTSNVFAILGLRALYFALAGIMERFHYLRYGLAAVLGFVGVKMLLEDLVHIPVLVALGVVAAILTVTIVISLRKSPDGEASDTG